MRKLSFEETKKIQLEILDVFMEYCETRKLRCWLESGTLLGAIRHKGYIPWDDDIDLGMLRDDFETMVHDFNSSGGRYCCICVENDPAMPYPFAKICDTKTVLLEKGFETPISIDVFPYDEITDHTLRRAGLFAARDFFCIFDRLRVQSARPNGNAFRRWLVYVGRVMASPFPIGYFAKKTADNAVRCRGEGHETVAIMTEVSGIRVDKSVFDSFTEAEFEGKMYPVPENYDELLKTLYGDYMTLPPEEERVTHHVFETYMKD